MPLVTPLPRTLTHFLGAAALAALCLTATAQAGVRYSITVDVVKGQTTIERTATAANNNNRQGGNNNSSNNNRPGGGGFGGGNNRGGGSNTTNQEIYFDITVRNNDKMELPNVVVEYAIYNETITNSTQDGRTTQLEEVRGTETIELAPNSKKTFQTRRVSNRDTRPTASRPTGNQNRNQNQQRQPQNRVTTTQNVDGWWVTVTVGDQQVSLKESQLGYKKKIEAEMAKQQAN